MIIAPPVSFEFYGICHGLAARKCKVTMSVSAVTPTSAGVGPIPKATQGTSIDLSFKKQL